MAAAESSAGKRFIQEEAATVIECVAGTGLVQTAREHWGEEFVSVRHQVITAQLGAGIVRKIFGGRVGCGRAGGGRHDSDNGSRQSQGACSETLVIPA